MAVEGCCHGELTNIYNGIRETERRNPGLKVDLLICCGDFQSVRDAGDLAGLACPQKYRRLGDFGEYHRGEKKV